jgi:uncharacterized membrane protein YphA (DoxX/SURF4 family)
MKPFESYFFQAIRVFLGSYYLISGLNYTFRFYPQPTGTGINAEFIDIITRNHIFTGVKALDIVAGLCIILNVFTPLMLILLFPVTVTILVYDLYTPRLFGLWTGGQNALFHCLLFFYFFRYYAPLFEPKPKHGSLKDVRPLLRDRLNGRTNDAV